MRSEIRQIESDKEALRWALGCVIATYSERLHAMNVGTPRISRAILGLEMLVCFTPLTWLCLFIIAHVNRMQGEGLVELSVAALGPIGLILAFKAAVLNRPSLNRVAALSLCISAAWTSLVYSLHVLAQYGGLASDWWRDFVLIALLPAAGIAHLIYLGLHQRGNCRQTSGRA